MARFDWIRFDPDGTGGGGTGDRRRVRRHHAGRGVDASSARTRPGRGERRHAADPGGARRHLPDPQRRQEPRPARRARRGRGRRPRSSTSRAPPSTTRPGIMVYGDDANFTKFGRIAHAAAGDEKFEFINEVNAVAAQRGRRLDGATCRRRSRTTSGLRLTSDGTNVTGAVLDRRARRGPRSGARRRCRPTPRSGCSRSPTTATGNPIAAFDSFTLTGDEVGGGGGGGTPTGPEPRRPVRRRLPRQGPLERDRARQPGRVRASPAAS